jgi:tetratricopeptide (TPR) repeat protein
MFPDFLYAALDKVACAAFIEESRMNFANATKLHRKSGVFPLKRLGVLTIRTSCLAALVLGVVWNVRFGVADFWARWNQPERTRLAMRWMPGNGAYPAQLADEIYALEPGSAKSLLQRAVQLNRYDAASWIQLGLLSEAANDLPGAEEALLQAARVDATFLPSWSLANFYFRRENTARFWYWALKAAQMDPDDAAPLFRLAWYVSPNAQEIRSRLQIKRPLLAVQFVNFLMAQGDPKAVAEAASPLLTANSESNTQTLLGVCDWLIANKRPDLALPLWNGLAAGGQTSYNALVADSTDAVTNGRFDKSPISRGFDWHLKTVEGVSSFLNVGPNALGFEFSGDEPDGFLLMDQTAPVREGQKYLLVVDYSTTGIAPGSGLEWSVTDERSGAALARTASLSAERGGKAYACFAAPDGPAFVRLSLLYQRQPGTVRVEGKLALKEVRLTGATAEHCAEQKISTSGAASPAF